MKDKKENQKKQQLSDETMFNNLITHGVSKADAFHFLAKKRAEKLLSAKGFEIEGLTARKEFDAFNRIVVRLDTFQAFKIYDNFLEGKKNRTEIDIYTLF